MGEVLDDIVMLERKSCVRDLVSLQVNDRGDEAVFNEDAPNGLPVGGTLVEQLADRLQGQFDHGRRIGHRPDLGQVFLFNRANSCRIANVNGEWIVWLGQKLTQVYKFKLWDTRNKILGPGEQYKQFVGILYKF